MYQFIASVSLAAFVALSAGPHAHSAQNPGSSLSSRSSPSSGPSPTPSASVTAVANGPILSQQASGKWTTTVVLQASDVCVTDLSYELVTTQPVMQVSGQPTSHAPIPQHGATPVPCPSPTTTEAEDVTLAFTLPSVPLAATLVVVDQHGTPPAAPTAIAMMAIHRYVSPYEYVWWPVISGLLLAFLFGTACGIAVQANPSSSLQAGESFKPIYASAAWTFKDSWATNIGVGAAAIAAILTGAGAVSTQFPGVQLDRYAVLMAACGLIIVTAPLVFGVLYAQFSRPMGTVPDNAELSLQGSSMEKNKLSLQGISMEIKVPEGASLTYPSLNPGEKDPFPVAPGIIKIGRNVALIIPGNGTIILKGSGSNPVLRTVASPGLHSPPPVADSVKIDSVEIDSPAELLSKDFPFVTIKPTGSAMITLPSGTTVKAPEDKEPHPCRAARLRVPVGSNVIVADFRSLIPAALVTMLGIGAELGILGVLAFSLSNRTAPIRGTALALVIIVAIVVLWYATTTTAALADSTPGSALTPDSSTSATL
jgi:hypothetical protein